MRPRLGRPCPASKGARARLSACCPAASSRQFSATSSPRWVAGLAELWEYQAEQTAPDQVVLRVVPAPRFTASTVAALRAEIEELPSLVTT